MVLFFSIWSCNDKTKKEKHSLEATLDVVIYKDEVLQLFYILQTDDGYTEPLSVKTAVKGSPDFQKVNFTLPKGIKPKNIRIDFGEKPGLDSFKMKEITLQYKDLKLMGERSKFQEWFDFNSNITFDSIKNMYYLKPTSDGFYDPQINGNETLNKRIIKLFPPDIDDVF